MLKALRDLIHKLNLTFILLVIAIITLLITVLYLFTPAYMMKIDNKVIGIVKDREEAYKSIENIKSDLKNQLAMEIKIQQEISSEGTFILRSKLTPLSIFKSNLEKNISIKVESYSINVNGKNLIFLKDKLTAEQVLESLKKEYLLGISSEEIKELSFIDKVEIIKTYTELNNIVDFDSALRLILEGKGLPEKYEVVEGDTIWDISIQKNISIDDIERLNPEINIDKLKIGQLINLSASQPLINVKTIQINIVEEDIPYNITYQETDELYIGQKNIKKSGKNGKKIIQAEISKINGILSDMIITAEEITQQPEDEIILRGTKQKPRTSVSASRGGVTRTQLASQDGKFIWPTPGYYNITSPFGSRLHPILKVYKTHTGIDTSAPLGTDVVAASDGKVIVSESNPSYGKRIIIDHGDGFSTMYAHNSKLLVEVGEKVEKGQVIAKVGSTGQSTGPHAHFEILINGKPVDPMLYFSK